MTVEFVIDGNTYMAKRGSNLVDAAAQNGVYIPTLGYLKGKECFGTCRVCSVKHRGKIEAGCTIKVEQGIEIELEKPEPEDIRKAMIELLFVEGNHYCPSCEKSGRCQLQAIAYEQKMTVPRFPYRYPNRDKDWTNERIFLERDRCIFCQRCVESVRDNETGRKIFAIQGRGHNACIAMDKSLADRMSAEQIAEAVDICPVGAILSKNQGFDEAIGKRKYDKASMRDYALNGDSR